MITVTNQAVYNKIVYKLIFAALIDSEQMLLSIEVQLCVRRECNTFRPRRPSSVAMHKVRVKRFALTCTIAVLQCSTFVLNLCIIHCALEFVHYVVQ